MTTKLTQPGQVNQKTYGTFTLVASIGVDGCRAINTFAGPTRVDALCLNVTVADDARAIYRAIRDGALAGKTADGIAEDVREVLVNLAAPLRGRAGYAPRVAELDRALDTVEPLAIGGLLAFASAVGDAVAAGAADANRPRTFAELKAAYAAGFARAS